MSKFSDLVARGKERGFITRVEILDALDSEVKDENLVNDIVLMIKALGIEILDHSSENKTKTDDPSGLTAREAKILRMRFGIEMSTNHILEEVDQQFGISRERIKKIEEKALRKLRRKKDDPDNDPEIA